MVLQEHTSSCEAEIGSDHKHAVFKMFKKERRGESSDCFRTISKPIDLLMHFRFFFFWNFKNVSR